MGDLLEFANGGAAQRATGNTLPAGVDTVGISVGCAQGDIVAVSYDQMQAGLNISASVVAANTVQVFLTNTTGSTITPSAGNVRVTVLRHQGI